MMGLSSTDSMQSNDEIFHTKVMNNCFPQKAGFPLITGRIFTCGWHYGPQI